MLGEPAHAIRGKSTVQRLEHLIEEAVAVDEVLLLQGNQWRRPTAAVFLPVGKAHLLGAFKREQGPEQFLAQLSVMP